MSGVGQALVSTRCLERKRGPGTLVSRVSSSSQHPTMWLPSFVFQIVSQRMASGYFSFYVCTEFHLKQCSIF